MDIDMELLLDICFPHFFSLFWLFFLFLLFWRRFGQTKRNLKYVRWNVCYEKWICVLFPPLVCVGGASIKTDFGYLNLNLYLGKGGKGRGGLRERRQDRSGNTPTHVHSEKNV